jgi:dienelactone hydrolase
LLPPQNHLQQKNYTLDRIKTGIFSAVGKSTPERMKNSYIQLRLDMPLKPHRTLLVLLLLTTFACRKLKNSIQPPPSIDTIQHNGPGNGEDTAAADPGTGGDTVGTDTPGKDTVIITPPPAPKYSQTPVVTSLGNNIGGLYESLPPGYDSLPGKKYPLLIFLHGGGERGDGSTQLPRLNAQSIPKMISQNRFPASFAVNGEEWSFVILCPQCKTDSWPTHADVNAVTEYGLHHYRVDAARVYVIGLSMGGGAAWDYARSYSTKLAAVVPICGASWPTTANIQKQAGTNLPIWAFHNKDDSVVRYNSTTGKYYTRLKNINAAYPIQLTLWETGGHDAWTRATDPDYRENGKNIYEWLLDHQKN